MIRSFINVSVFATTVLWAAFGQNVFGRTHIEQWAHKVEHKAPIEAAKAWQKTDIFLASLAPGAGTPAGTPVCMADTNLYQKHNQTAHDLFLR